MKLKIHGKLLLYILTTAVFIYVAAISYIYTVMNKNAKENTIKITQEAAEKYASAAGAELNNDLIVARTIRQCIIKYPKLSEEERVEIFNPILEQIVMSNPNYISVWYSWELNTIDEDYIKPYGRIRTTFFRQGDVKKYIAKPLDTISNTVGSTYYKIKINPEEILTNPYYDNYTGKASDNLLVSTIATPMHIDNKFAGLVGIDFALDRFQIITENMKPFEDAHSFIVANNGNIVAFSNKDYSNTPLSKFFFDEESEYNLSEKITEGMKFSFYTKKEGIKYYVSLLPLNIGNSSTPWAIGIMTPVSTIMRSVATSTFMFIMLAFLGLLILTYMIWLISKRITKSLKITADVINKMVHGNINKKNKLETNSYDEIADIGRSVNTLIDSLNKTAAFAGQIGTGNPNYEYTPLGKYDVLGNSLLQMRKSLQIARDEELKRKEEDRKHNWATHGAAKFAEIIRQYSDDLEGLAYQIISELVKYINANQGGLFIINKDKNKNQYIDLIASYAFERRKMKTKRIPFGVGLISRCILEKDTIYMTNIPNDYINITSGLGESNPKYLIVVPLIFNKETFGAVELASFFDMKKYQIEFVEKVGESIASAISMVNINVKTNKLLEETRLKSDEMASQEEEIRQNIEEMKSLQEDLNDNVDELTNVWNAVNAVSYVVEYDLNGKVTDVNDSFLKVLQRDKMDMVGKYQGSFGIEPQNIDYFNHFWDELRAGIIKTSTQDVSINKKNFLFYTIYSPVFDKSNKVKKVISFSRITN